VKDPTQHSTTEQMKAVVVRHGRRFRYERVEKPRAGPGEIVIRIEAAGICAADRKIYSGNHPWQLPDVYVPGHEYVGTVVEMGEGGAESSGLGPGDRITAEIIVPCRTCWFCQRGLYHLCDRPGVCVGAWAEYLKIPRGAIVHRVPADLPAEQAALVEPLSCSIHGVELARIGLDDAVVVAGLGAIGMGMLQVARLKTPRLLIGLDIDDGLTRTAQESGAACVFNPARDDVAAQIRALTDGRGCDVYIEASGSPESIKLGLEVLRKAGRLVIFGVYGHEAAVDFNVVSEFKALEIIGGHLSPNVYPLAIEYLAEGLVNANAIVTHVFPLAEFEQAIAIKHRPGVTSIKTILIP
jgi:threonine dehydrogenase-like Zn-dependent dehydrogenase